jgi:hypothetical protein
MATQLETLGLIADNLNKVWLKLCEIQTGGKEISIDIPDFYNEFGDVTSDHEITVTEGDTGDAEVLAGIISINNIYTKFTDALFEYASKKDQQWTPPPPP